MQKFTMEVSKKEVIAGQGQYVKQGEVEVFYPLLSEMGIAVEPKETDKEGFPVYADEKVQFVFDSMLAAVKAMARNKLQPGTATLKAGLSIASTVEELLETGGRTGEALAITREFLAAFKAWLPSTGKSEKVQATLYEACRNKAGLMLLAQDKKEKVAGYLAQFAESLNEEQIARFSRPLLALNEACQSSDGFEDA